MATFKASNGYIRHDYSRNVRPHTALCRTSVDRNYQVLLLFEQRNTDSSHAICVPQPTYLWESYCDRADLHPVCKTPRTDRR